MASLRTVNYCRTADGGGDYFNLPGGGEENLSEASLMPHR
jgi:hypothetical protein